MYGDLRNGMLTLIGILCVFHSLVLVTLFLAR
jgi:hypothetical protein